MSPAERGALQDRASVKEAMDRREEERKQELDFQTAETLTDALTETNRLLAIIAQQLIDISKTLATPPPPPLPTNPR